MSEAPTPEAVQYPPGYIEPLTGEDDLRFPEGYTLTTSWQRAQSEPLEVSPINDHEAMVRLGEGSYHRAVWYLSGTSLRARCDCQGYQHNDRCAHLYALFWEWVNGELITPEPEHDREHHHPPEWLSVEGSTQ
jgi:hypothetical protein